MLRSVLGRFAVSSFETLRLTINSCILTDPRDTSGALPAPPRPTPRPLSLTGTFRAPRSAVAFTAHTAPFLLTSPRHVERRQRLFALFACADHDQTLTTAP